MPRHTASRVWRPLLVAWLILQPSHATGQETPVPVPPRPTREVLARLAQAAGDSRLEPWQRDFMRSVAKAGPERAAPERSPVFTRTGPPPVGSAAYDGAWTGLPPPLGRYQHSAIYDPVRDRLVVFGGNTPGPVNDVWALSLPGSVAWSSLAPTGGQPSGAYGRYGHTAIYDPVRDRMVVFGGLDGTAGFRNDVWALSLAGSPVWSALAPPGSPPPGRYSHTAIYDPVRDRMIVFGGRGQSGVRFNDVWALSLAGSPVWSALDPAGTPPSARQMHTAIYDPARDRMIVFGGSDGSSRNDVWALSFSGSPEWSELAPAGSPPSARHMHTATYDPARDRMIVFGGSDGSSRDDVWALSLAGDPAWSALAPAGSPPSARHGHTTIYDPVRDRLVVFGGYGGGGRRNDAWALSLSEGPAWSVLAMAGSLPSGRFGHASIYDPVRDRMVVFGGFDGSYRNDVWVLSLAGDPAWSALTPAGVPPPGRRWHTAIYDPLRDRMVVFGGFAGGSPYLGDVWALSLAGSPAWTALWIDGPRRLGHTAIYDPARDRMVVFGGFDGTVYRSDVLGLSLGGTPAWSVLAITGTPPVGRDWHTAIHDPLRDRMVVFGGYDGSSVRDDAWALTFSGAPAWSVLAIAGSPPSGRYGHTAIYDPARDRMVVFGGDSFNGYPTDAWGLSLAEGPGWSALSPAGAPPSGRLGHTAIYDPVRDRMVVFGNYPDYLNDAWLLGWGATVSVPGDVDGTRPGVELGRPHPSPSRAETFVEFDLRAPGRVLMEVFDISGRRVMRIADGWFTAGRHVSTWRGDDEDGRALGSGVYFIRMRSGDVQATRRTVRVR